MPTVGEVDYEFELSGTFEVAGKSRTWRVTRVSKHADTVYNAMFVEVGVNIDGAGDVSIRAQVDTDEPDVRAVVGELEGLIEELAFLRAARVVRKGDGSKHRSLIGVV